MRANALLPEQGRNVRASKMIDSLSVLVGLIILVVAVRKMLAMEKKTPYKKPQAPAR
jgi:hypothetical protein